jgi:signal peptidase II
MIDMLRQRRLSLAIAALVIAVDQITKTWALNALDDRTIDLIWTLRFNLAFNRGMAFSRGDALGPIIGVVALVVVIVFVTRAKTAGTRLGRIALGLIVGGALGNIADRLFRDDAWLRGAVVDFIDVQWWPIFNVADIGVTVGGVLFAISAYRNDRVRARASVAAEATEP